MQIRKGKEKQESPKRLIVTKYTDEIIDVLFNLDLEIIQNCITK